MKRSDYRIVKYQYDERPNYFLYRVDQKFLWFFWVTPSVDNILAHYVPWSSENYRRAKDFDSKQSAENAINYSLGYWNTRSKDEVVG